ncbi:BspA family leucine-rich repeat surface protein [Brachyspira pulli]|uniref:BspA family leucine-rich repeat surface protein n=1 Tax=Brachyspira pulli TaxID=310721 RepID=UPI003005198D
MKYKPKYKFGLLDYIKDESINLADIDTSDMIDMSYLFEDSKRKNFDGIETWNVSNVTDMKCMFKNAEYFNADLSKWNVFKVLDMSEMFSNTKYFNCDLTSWNIDNVKYFENIFENADSFKHIKTVLKFYNKCKSRNYKKKLQSMLETFDIKEVYRELINDKTYYKKNKDFIKKLENIYYDELKDIILEY